MIHKFEMNGYKLVLDVNSGSVHVLDDVTFDLLDFAGEEMPDTAPAAAMKALDSQYAEEDLSEGWAELYGLYRQDVLFSKDIYANLKNVGQKAPVKSMCLNVAHDCNLRCRYCFASTGDFGGGRALMPFEVGRAALDFLLKSSGSRRNLELDFFGGEPLMNFDVVKRLVAYGRQAEKPLGKNIRFTITTNALLLDDEKIDFINREMHNVVLSIDGRPQVNDRMRPRADGSGSYDTILKNIRKLVERRQSGADADKKTYYVRGTFTRENLDFAADVLHLADLGFKEVSVEPVVLDADSPMAIRESDLPAIFTEYETLAKEMIRRKKEGGGFHFFHFMVDLDNGPCAIKLLRGCGCGNEYVAITPDGDIYPCHQFVGQTQYIMGNVLQSGITAVAMKDTFSRANIFTKEGCSDCWARFFCSGGCNANNHSQCGDIHRPFKLSCELEKKRVECALMMRAALS